MTTIFGPDISSYQHGVNVRALTDPFCLLKCTEGTYYVDADYENWLGQAKASGKLVIPYHFISAEDPDTQAAHLAAHIIDKTLPVMLDWEPTATYRPTLAQLLAVADALVRHGLRPKLAYAPKWYWGQIGSPSLTGLSDRGMGLVSSEYPGGSGYPGDNADGWSPYGGMTPILYQFTDVAVEGGQTVGDRNAYRGTIQQLAAFLGATTPAPSTTGGSTVGTIPASIGQMWPEIAGQFPANGQFADETALIWADGGARAAALYAKQARDAINALAARQAPAPSIDVNALAAALAPHLAAGATADELAAAVLHHLSAATANG